MIAPTLTTLAILAVIGNGSLFAQQNERAKVGDLIVIQLTGPLAAEYGKRTGAFQSDRVPPALQFETTATIVQQLKDGGIRVEHTSHIVRDGEPARLVTLTASVESTRLTTKVIPKGIAVYSTPAEHKDGTIPMLTTMETKTGRLTPSDLKGLKLRTWTLAEEVGD